MRMLIRVLMRCRSTLPFQDVGQGEGAAAGRVEEVGQEQPPLRRGDSRGGGAGGGQDDGARRVGRLEFGQGNLRIFGGGGV